MVVGLTPQQYTGNLGGRPGAHALCSATYANSHFCSTLEYINSPSPIGAPAGGAWVDGSLPATGSRLNRSESATCAMWTSGLINTGSEGAVVLPSGSSSTSYLGLSNAGCQTPRPLFCCA